MNGNAKLQRMPFVFALLIQKLPKWTGMQHQFVSKMDLEPVKSENAAIMQWCCLKPSFVPWLYQTFMIIQDKERAMFFILLRQRIVDKPFIHREGGRFLTKQEQRKGFKEQQGINRSPSNS